MKKLFAIWCAVLAMAILMGVVACASAETYATTFVVVDTRNDVLTMVDFNGNEWQWDGVEDWERGDVVSAIMDDNNTAIIYDDAIINIQYSGYVDGWIERVCR